MMFASFITIFITASAVVVAALTMLAMAAFTLRARQRFMSRKAYRMHLQLITSLFFQASFTAVESLYMRLPLVHHTGDNFSGSSSYNYPYHVSARRLISM